MSFKLVTPHAAVLIWGYNDRVDSRGATANSAHEIDTVTIGTSSIISITTSKSKSSPSGQFEIRLAPRFNWVTRITPGSWCVIMMSQDKLPTMSENNVGQANERSFKMLGRIDSVRGVVEVDQNTGARKTVFIISGRDWGSVFESVLYIDPILANNNLKTHPIAQAYSILGLDLYKSYDKRKGMPSSGDLVRTIVNLWGGSAVGTAVSQAKADFTGPPLSKPSLSITSGTQFRLPKEVAIYMGQGAKLSGLSPPTPAGNVSYNFADAIQIYQGKLTALDKGQSEPYTPLHEAFGRPNVHNFFKQSTFWQLLTELSNITLNELITDIRWENGSPKFALYHRIRPFVNNPNFLNGIKLDNNLTEPDVASAEKIVNENMSLFKFVKQVEIDYKDIVSINFGTNWRDKVNFIEITPTSQEIDGDDQIIVAKTFGQTYDPVGYERDGFKPMNPKTAFLPYTDKTSYNIKQMTHWKFLLREWHFNNHLLLNGAITFIGQSKYIQVGDNIKIDSKILGNAPVNVGQKKASSSYLLAHVENISHTFSVNPESGARSFMTTIQFVRGVITDKEGKPLTLSEGGNALDKFAEVLKPKDERNSNVFGTSVESDPDVEKLGKGGLT